MKRRPPSLRGLLGLATVLPVAFVAMFTEHLAIPASIVVMYAYSFFVYWLGGYRLTRLHALIYFATPAVLFGLFLLAEFLLL